MALTIAIALPTHLAAQEKEKLVPQPLDAPAPRFPVEPTLAALLQAAHDIPEAERSVGNSAWIVLALIANGSTMRSGSHGGVVRTHVEWLVSRQTATGAFAVRGVPCSRSEQQLAAFAIVEALAASGHYVALEPDAKLAIGAMEPLMLGPLAPPATLEEFVSAMLIARSASLSIDPGSIAASSRVRDRAKSGMNVGKLRRTDAALHLDDLLRGSKHPPELTVARTWPANLTADPLHTLVAALAVSRTDEKTRATQFGLLAAIVAARETEGEHAATWAPAGGFDRLATTAMHTITLALGNGQTPLFCAK